MKTARIIRKNIKLLLRSRVSTIVLTLGPLLVILLVGISFSTSTFNLNIGIYSEKYSELSNSYVETLKSENYVITKYPTEIACNNSVKEGESHACVVFPPDLNIENEQTNIINFHVDQSNINLVYLVMSTLTKSFGEKTTEISKDLTSTIITTLFDTKEDLDETDSFVEEIRTKNTEIYDKAGTSLSILEELDLSADKVDVSKEVTNIIEDIDRLQEDSLALIESGLEVVDDLEEYEDQVNENISGAYENKLEELTENLNELNSTISNTHNDSIEKLYDLLEEIDDGFAEMSEKLDAAEDVNLQVIDKLKEVRTNSNDLKEEAKNLESNVKAMISRINSVQITDPENIVNPITMKINKIAKSHTNLGFLFPTLIILMIMFIGLLLPSTLIIMEKNSRAYFRIFTTPTRNWLFSFATYLTSMILISSQVIIILAVSQFYFKINFLSSFMILFISLGLIMSFFILLGMLIGYIFNTEEMAMFAAVGIGTVLLLTSGMIFPLESMPAYIIEKAKFNPVVLGSGMFKKSLLFDVDFSSVQLPFLYLLSFSAILFVLIFVIKKAEKIHFILKKPTRLRIKKDYLRKQFDFGERKAKTLPEFIVATQNLSDDKFHILLKQNAYRDWFLHIHKNKYLANKVEDCKTRQTLINTLVEELKKTVEQKKK